MTMHDDWYHRNKDKLGQIDIVSALIERSIGAPTHVLEIGCSNGWRLKKLRDRYGCEVDGVEISQDAVKDSYEILGDRSVIHGSAQDIPFVRNTFDLVILGYCCYVIDPNDYFQVMANSNRVLMDGGMLVVHDALSPRPMKRKLQMDEGKEAFFYSTDLKSLWTAHPFYKSIAEELIAYDNGLLTESIFILQKSTKGFERGPDLTPDWA